MKILFWVDDLMTRTRVESRWRQAGADILRRHSDETPELIVIDLTAADALGHIGRLREAHPEVDILAFGPHVDGAAFKQARAAGATSVVARGKVVERVLGLLGK